MMALSLLSIGLLLAALAGCAVLWTRSGEIRVGLFGALFALIAIHQAAVAWTNRGDPLAWNASSFGALAGLAVGTIGVLALVALWRTLAERDRAEKLHWDSMETVRVINELIEADAISFDTKIEKLLAAGIARFDLEVAMLARIHKSRYEVVAIQAPESIPISPGAVFSLEETYCKYTLRAERPIGIEQIQESNWVGSLGRAAFPFNAYLGAPIVVDGTPYGTLSFASLDPREDRFNGTEKDLIRLMAQWIGAAIGKRKGREVRVGPAIEGPTLALPAPPSSPATPRSLAEPAAAKPNPSATRTRKRTDRRYVEPVIDPNRVLQRMASELRALTGSAVDFALKLDPKLGFAAAQNLPLKAIARTLVMNARDAMPDGGHLVVETANLDIAAGEPGQVPARAPNRYVTLSFADTGSEPDPDALSRLFDRAPSEAGRSGDGDRLALSTVYRILQICGGDLSVKIEPGRGSTYTVYLPRARAQVQAPRKAAPTLAPAPLAPSAH